MNKIQAREDAGQQPVAITPAAAMRRGAAIMAAVCVAALAIGRFCFWRGAATGQIAATALLFLMMYTIFGLVQLVFGASFNEYTQNFVRITGRQKLICVGMIVLTMALLIPGSDWLFPGIWDKNLLFR